MQGINYIWVKLGEEYLADFKSLFYFSDITKLKLKETKIKFWRLRFYIHTLLQFDAKRLNRRIKYLH